jgi:hypothetical protein
MPWHDFISAFNKYQWESLVPETQKPKTPEEAIRIIEGLYPPDSKYDDTRTIGRDLMDNTVGNIVGYNQWRELLYSDLFRLAYANISEHNK